MQISVSGFLFFFKDQNRVFKYLVSVLDKVSPLPLVVEWGPSLFSQGPFSSSPDPFLLSQAFLSRPGPFMLNEPFFKQKGPLAPMPGQVMMSSYYKPFGQSGGPPFNIMGSPLIQ